MLIRNRMKRLKILTEFAKLIDGPGGYSGQSGKFLIVKVSEDGLEFTAIDPLAFTAAAAPAYQAGLLFYDEATDCLSFYNAESDVTLQIGQEHWVAVRNDSGDDIPDFTPVYQTGAVGHRTTIAKAKADNLLTSAIVGITTHAIENNTNGFVTNSGVINNVDTDGSVYGESWSAGDTIYLDPDTAGSLTKVRPNGDNFAVHLGHVLDATNNGSFLCQISHVHLGNIKVGNNEALQGWNYAENAWYELIKINPNDLIELDSDGRGSFFVHTVSGGLESLTITTSASLTAQQCRGVAIDNYGQSGAITPVLPTCAEGLHGKITIATTGYAFHLDVQAADISYFDGTLLDAGDKISNLSPGMDDELYFEAVLKAGGGYRWKFISGQGSWIDGGA